MIDSFEARGKRKRLVDELRVKGIADEEVLRAINTVPRHIFMDPAFLTHAYTDKAFPITSGQTISQPFTVAFQTQLLEVMPNDKILEIGTGSGYQTAILLELGARVYTIERQRELFIKAQDLLGNLGYKPHFFFGDGLEGKPTYGPFDKILITAAADHVPEKLLQQLKTGGIIVVPVGERYSQSMVKIVKESEIDYKKTSHGAFVFVPLLRGTEG